MCRFVKCQNRIGTGVSSLRSFWQKYKRTKSRLRFSRSCLFFNIYALIINSMRKCVENMWYLVPYWHEYIAMVVDSWWMEFFGGGYFGDEIIFRFMALCEGRFLTCKIGFHFKLLLKRQYERYEGIRKLVFYKSLKRKLPNDSYSTTTKTYKSIPNVIMFFRWVFD